MGVRSLPHVRAVEIRAGETAGDVELLAAVIEWRERIAESDEFSIVNVFDVQLETDGDSGYALVYFEAFPVEAARDALGVLKS